MSDTTNSMKPLEMDSRRIGAGWLNKTKAGKKYMKFTVDRDLKSKQKFVVFPNGFKDKDSSPDYILYLSDQDNNKSNAQEPQPEEMLG